MFGLEFRVCFLARSGAKFETKQLTIFRLRTYFYPLGKCHRGSVATTYYNVIPVGGQWAMTVAGHDQSWLYATQDEALNVAMDAARHLWQTSGLRSVVRLQDTDGEWQRKRVFGGETPMPSDQGIQRTG